MMARLPCLYLSDQPLHVIQRGNNRDLIFAADADYHFYLRCLQEAADTHSLTVHAYVLMTNYVHLLVTPATESSLSKADVEAIRNATNKGWVLGDSRFGAKVAALTARRIMPLPRGRLKREVAD